jgi:hypothetical protein
LTAVPCGTGFRLGARQTLGRCHRLNYCKLPIANFRFLIRNENKLEIGNWQLAMILAN